MSNFFTVTENELFNFESFCDSKYMDATCQKFGFFKIKLAEGCAGQCSSMDEFMNQFGSQCSKKIAKSVIIRNRRVTDLFGMITTGDVPFKERKDFISSTNAEAFQVSSNCCLKELQGNGPDAFLAHFYETISRQSVELQQNTLDLSTLRKRSSMKRIAFEERQAFKNIVSMEGKRRCIEMAMAMSMSSESLMKPSHPKCLCLACSPVKCTSGYGALYCPGIEENENNYLHITANFAMSHLSFTNMVSDLHSGPGNVPHPALYLSSSHSMTPLSIERLSLWRFNFLFYGYPKFWIVIPPSAASSLTGALQRKGAPVYHTWCQNVLNHKFGFIPTVKFLKDEHIPYQVVFQYPGEGLVFLPNAAHAAGSLGPSLSEGANFGTHKWVPYGCVSPQCACQENTAHVNLSEFLAVHQSSLLKAYHDGNIIDEVDDPYFHKSILVPKKVCPVTQEGSASCPLPLGSSNEPLESGILKGFKARVQCPFCCVTWAYVQKANMKHHFKKYHGFFMQDEKAVQFLKRYSIVV